MKKKIKYIQGFELFAGSCSLSNALKSKGVNCTSIDIRKRKGICEPDLCLDISKVSSSLLMENYPDHKVNFIWLGLPCDIWSYASGGFHLDSKFKPKTQKAVEHIELLKKCQDLINEINPDIFFIENPRGKLRHYPPFVEWLKSNQAFELQLTMSSYGFPTTKPTNIFTNATGLKFKQLDSFGRGAKCLSKFDNLTTCQRQKYPVQFVDFIADFICNYNFPTFEKTI